MIEVFCDGSITGSHWGKKGQKDTLAHAWSGWYARDAGGHVLHWKSSDLGEGLYMSANVAEYHAVGSALAWIRKSVWKKTAVEINSDSQVIIRQLQRKYECYDPQLLKLRNGCHAIANALEGGVTYRWIRREQNKEADVLSKALQTWGRQPTWDEVLGAVK